MRYHSPGRLPLSAASTARNRRLLDGPTRTGGSTTGSTGLPGADLFQALRRDIDYFPLLFGELPQDTTAPGSTTADSATSTPGKEPAL